MKRRAVEVGKDILIVLLVVSLVLLMRRLLPNRAADEQTLSPQLSAAPEIAAKPILISLSSEAGRMTVAGDAERLESAWEQWGSLLGQAMETAENAETQPMSAFQDAMETSGALFSFAGEIPVQAVGVWLGGSGMDSDAVCRDYLLSAQGDTVSLWICGDACVRYETQLPSEMLTELLTAVVPDGSAFCFEREPDGALHPLTVWSEGALTAPAATWENPCDSTWAKALASELSFNPYGSGTYTDPQGNTVFTEASRTCSVEASGVVTLQRTGEGGALGTAAAQTPAAFVEAARSVAQKICAPSGEAKLYLTGFSQQGAETVCRFQYVVNGIPVSPEAAVVTFSEQEIVSVEALVRALHTAAGTKTLMPISAAAVISPRGSRLTATYALGPSGTVTAGWEQS